MVSMRAWLGAGLCLFMVVAQAADEQRYDRLHFQVERSEQVANDRMQVWLTAQAQGDDPAQLAKTINQSMEWALATARERAGTRIKTGNYQTYPLRDKDQVQSWQASQDLLIEGADIPAISALVGELQARLQVKSMAFTVSDEARRSAEERMIEVALQAFQARAANLQQIMAAKGYRMVEANIQTGGRFPGPVSMLRAQTASFEASMPAVQAGDSEVSVTVSGSIELVMP